MNIHVFVYLVVYVYIVFPVLNMLYVLLIYVTVPNVT